MTTTITHATYKSWSGGAARGGPPFKDPVDTHRHADRAVWLAGQLEAPSWGVVQSYDGCAMSGGILNNIAVSPKDNSQGSFFALLSRVFDDAHAVEKATGVASPVATRAAEAIMKEGWVLTEDGVLRTKVDGRKVPGLVIRNTFSPPNGHVPASGPQWDQAVKWLTIFHELFSDPSTFAAQSSYAISWLAAGAATDEKMMYRRYVDGHLDTWIGLQAAQMDPYFELAMCVYHAFSVNAPGEARLVIGRVPLESVRQFAKDLIHDLGTVHYGAWHDTVDNHNRYDRTRIAVWSRPDLWDTTIAHEIMPKDFPAPAVAAP